jgi:pimeloyl-ACP methyl ester carboxylesterase
MQKEVDDLDALLKESGAHHVFGLSAGALITLQAVLTLPAIHKAVICEPPLLMDKPPTAMVTRYESEMAQDKVPAALITAMKAAKLGPPIFNLMPRKLLEWFTDRGMKAEEKNGSGGYPPMRELAGTIHYDFQLVVEMSGTLERFRGVRSDVLLLNGSKSPAYLKGALDALEQVIPGAKRVVLPGLDHAAAWNHDRGGQPERVASALRDFFSTADV